MILVIGYGNPLRGDDGVGWVVTESLKSAPGVEVITAQMLVPELAARIGAATAVIFVDARVGADEGSVHCDAIGGRADRHSLGHVAIPEGLLDLAEALSGHRPRAFVVSVTGADFGFRLTLSAPILHAVHETIQIVQQLIDALISLPDIDGHGFAPIEPVQNCERCPAAEVLQRLPTLTSSNRGTDHNARISGGLFLRRRVLKRTSPRS